MIRLDTNDFLNKSIWLIDGTLIDTPTLGQSESGSKNNEGGPPHFRSPERNLIFEGEEILSFYREYSHVDCIFWAQTIGQRHRYYIPILNRPHWLYTLILVKITTDEQRNRTSHLVYLYIYFCLWL